MNAGMSADVRTQMARVLADAASFRRQRFYARAIETLRGGLELAPRSYEVREVLFAGPRAHRAAVCTQPAGRAQRVDCYDLAAGKRLGSYRLAPEGQKIDSRRWAVWRVLPLLLAAIVLSSRWLYGQTSRLSTSVISHSVTWNVIRHD